MKTLIGLIVMTCGTHLAFSENKAEEAESWYKKGLAAEKAGDPATAIAAYKAALDLNSKHANARYRIGEVKNNAAGLKADAREAKIGSVKIPTYQIENLTVQEALDVLTVAIEKQSNKEITPNFVIEDPGKKLTDVKVTLNLKNVPVSGILGYIHAQSNTRVRYDEHAVVILAR